MANGLFTPLQLTAAYGIGTNTALRIPASVILAYSGYNAIPLIAEINSAIYNVTHSSWASDTVKNNVQSIAGTSNECPALGSTKPPTVNLVDYYNTRYYPGFAGYLQYIADLYIGNAEPPAVSADESIFCQGFMASVAYCDSINTLINSSTNAQTYLGPTFPGNDALITNSVSNVNPDFANFANDLSAQGQLTNFADIDLYGTPAGLLRQIANVAVINGGTLRVIQTQMNLVGLLDSDIRTLINRPDTTSDNEFNKLQMLAYQAMTQVTGADLQQVLDILDITTPNINTMADLLNQQKIFPASYLTLQSPTADGFVPIYQSNGSVNIELTPNVVAVTGCEELGKVMPPDQAVASKAVQAGFQQITGLEQSTPAELAQAIQTVDPDSGAVVAGLSTTAGLPLIQNQTSVLDPAVVSYYAGKSTGSGANGTITVSDVIGSLWGYNVTSYLNSAAGSITSLPSGATSTLLSIYNRMVNVTNGVYGSPSTGPITIPAGPAAGSYADGNAAMAALIVSANTEISSIAVSYSSQCASINSDFDTIANQLYMESQYQSIGGVSYGSYQANSQPSITAFVQNLPRYGQNTEPNGTAYFLNQVADTDTLGGQAIVAVMREGVNSQQLNAAGLGTDIKPASEPENPPAPVVTPVY